MAFTMPDYPLLSDEQVNPFANAVSKALSGYNEGLKTRFAKPKMEQELQKAILENLWNPRLWESEIGLRGAQAGLAGSEAAKNRFLVGNPQYISPEGMLISQALGQRNPQSGVGSNGNAGGGYQSQPQASGNYPRVNQNRAQALDQGVQDEGLGQGYSLSPEEQQHSATMKPGDSMVIGQGQSQPQQQSPQQLPADSSQYSPDALAFNPPQMQSPTGNPQLDTLWYKKFGMPPVSQAQMDIEQKKAEKYNDTLNEKNTEFASQANFANESTLNAHKFLDALDRSVAIERGAIPGGMKALTNAAMEMDGYSSAMAAAATSLFKEGNAIHKSDIELQQMLKPNRKLNKDVAFDFAQGVIAKNDRMKERQQFYARGSQLKLRPDVLDSMWNKYETDRPYINSESKMPNDAYKGTWQDYLRPESINSFVSGKDFTPPNQKPLQGMNWTGSDLKDIKKWAYDSHLDPNMFTKEALYKGAKDEGITLAQLKLALMKRGALRNG
jgi:hypothetical protein